MASLLCHQNRPSGFGACRFRLALKIVALIPLREITRVLGRRR